MEMLAIERELMGPRGGIALKHHVTVLDRLERRIGVTMAGGLPPGEYAAVDSLRKAVRQAQGVLRLVYGQRDGI